MRANERTLLPGGKPRCCLRTRPQLLEQSPDSAVAVRPFARLDQDEIACWRAFQAQVPGMRNPFLCPEFTQLVSDVCPGIQIGVVQRQGSPVGFFPFQEVRPGVAVPVGNCLSGLQGIIGEGLGIEDADGLMKSLGLSSWSFGHLEPSQEIFEPFIFERHESPCIVVDEGFDAYLSRRMEQGHTNRNHFNAERKARSLKRRMGSIRVEIDSRDESLLDHLVTWKRHQMKMTRHRDLFIECPWAENFVTRSLRRSDNAFRGQLAVLFVDDVPVAALYGLRSREVLHGLLLGFDRRLARFSPGIILLVELSKRMSRIGVTQLNLGRGREFYKQTLKSDSLYVGAGGWSRSRLLGRLDRERYRIRTSVARSPAGPVIRSTWGEMQRSADFLLQRRERVGTPLR